MRVGIDLVQVADVTDSLARFGERYLRRIFTPRELADCGSLPAQAARLAARVAAKEAAFKVLRPGADEALGWTEVEVERQPGGWCSLNLSGGARESAERQGLLDFQVSLSHEGAYATAVVVASTGAV